MLFNSAYNRKLAVLEYRDIRKSIYEKKIELNKKYGNCLNPVLLSYYDDLIDNIDCQLEYGIKTYMTKEELRNLKCKTQYEKNKILDHIKVLS